MCSSRLDPSSPSDESGSPIVVYINGKPAKAFKGETVASVLLANNIRSFRRTVKTGRPRGIFCGIGICHDCLVTVDGVPNTRACVTFVREGMVIETDTGAGL